MADIEKGHTKEESTRPVSFNSVTVVTHDSGADSAVAQTAPALLPASHDDGFPDGGRRAWTTVLGAFLAVFCTFGQLNSFGTFQTWYADHQLQHLPPSTISWIGSLQLWVFFFSGGFIGRLFDAYGPRRILAAGTFVLVFGTMMTSIASAYYEYILAQGILCGSGIGIVFYPLLAAVSTHFLKYRATALGIAVTGGVVYPIMLHRLFATVGFAWSVRISGFISLALCSLAVALISSRLTTQRRAPAPAPTPTLADFADAPFVLVTLGCALISFGIFMPFFYVAEYATDAGIAPATAIYTLSVMNAGGTLQRFAPALVSDRLGRFNVFVPSALLAGVFVLGMWPFAQGAGALMAFAALYGVFSGALNALVVPAVAQISDIRQIGMRIGVLYNVISFPALCGSPAAGAILRANGGSYMGMIVLSGTTMIAGSGFLLLARLRLSTRLCDRV